MSIQTDVVTALSSVAGGRIYPQIAEAGATLPFVVYRLLSKDPSVRLSGKSGVVNSTIEFLCWGETYAEAISLAESVRSAIDSASLITYEDSASGDDYDFDTDYYVEPVVYGFWHS